MKKIAVKAVWLWLGMLAVNVQAQDGPVELFPMPEVIRNNVEFWKKVYAVYPTTQVIIHDTEDLSRIYEIVDLEQVAPGQSYRQQWHKVEEIKEEYRAILRSLARRQLNMAGLSTRSARVVEIFGTEADPNKLERVAQSIRGQLGLKDRFRQGLERSGLYRDAIAMIFAEHGLPLQLIMLPHVESSFNYKAYSKVGAAGIWQFTRYTGRLFMKIDYDVDERLDPIRATEAAARLLRLNYSELGAWPLAITAYNHGLNGMKRAKDKFGTDFARIYLEYDSRMFGFASKNFYSEFLAALEVAENYSNYFGEVEFHRPAEYVEFELGNFVNVNNVLETYGLELNEFSEFNPALRQPVVNSKRRIPKGYLLRLPKRLGSDPYALAMKIDPGARHTQQVASDWVRVTRTDSLPAIASRLNTSAEVIKSSNQIPSSGKVEAGTILNVPISEKTMLASAEPNVVSPSEVTSIPVTPLPMSHVTNVSVPEADILPVAEVSRTPLSLGEEFDLVSRAEREAIITYDIEPQSEPTMVASTSKVVGLVRNEIATATPINGLNPPPVTRSPVVSEWIVVEPEETIGHYAQWLELPARRLRELNGLRYNQDIHIGQRIRLSFDRVSAQDFERQRYEYRRSIEEDFFSTYQVESLKTHRITRGENIWHLCNEVYDIPIWLVTKYNPNRDLFKLSLNDTISVPMVVTVNPAATPSVPE